MLAYVVGLVSAAGSVAPDGFTPQPGWRAVPVEAVRVDDAFWSARMAANAGASLRANFEQCVKTGRIDNFRRAAGAMPGPYAGLFFNDSDVYKVIEGASIIYGQTRDPALRERIDEVVALIAGAQQSDGYINGYFTVDAPDKKLTNLKDMHELYCGGHLMEAGVAHFNATGERTLLDVACRFADLLGATYGPGRRLDVCGHPEVELALIKLGRATGRPQYEELAKFFLEQRGNADRPRLYGEYYLDHAPILQQPEAVGHAVRAMYLYSAAADAWYPADPRAVERLGALWDDVVLRKMYVTGGIGSSADNEGFTHAFDLPNDSAYAETCAGIGLAIFSARLAVYGRPGAADTLERCLYNGVLSGVSLDGSRFNYVNPLASRGGHHRQDWFACACCPPNILRTIASIGGYIYAQDADSLRVNLYVGSEARVRLAGADVGVRQTSAVPWEGHAELTLTPVPDATFELLLRIPAWGSAGMTISVNGEPSRPAQGSDGYVSVTRRWHAGDRVAVDFPLAPHRTHADLRVESDRGRVAITRGPLVYCLEGADNGGSVRSLAVGPDSSLASEFRPDLLGGVVVVTGDALRRGRDGAPTPAPFVAVPYYAWDNRAPGEMIVWVAEKPDDAERPLDPAIRASASHCYGNDTVLAAYDEAVPDSSLGDAVSRMTWWPKKGSAEWIQYDFDTPRSVSSASVYWFDDTPRGGGCAVPESWTLRWFDGTEWREVTRTGGTPGVERDRLNVVRFEPVTARAVRLDVKLREGASAGVLEWRVGN